jgi:hypothetical protein
MDLTITILVTTDIDSNRNVKVRGESTRGGVQTLFNGEEFRGDEEYEDAEEPGLLMMGHTGATTLDKDFASRTVALS